METLLICDEPDETAILGLVAQRAGTTVRSMPRLELALKALAEQPADMVVVALRGGSLLEIVRRVRQTIETPLLVISPSRDEDTLCRLYAAGADWVQTRPYSARLLIMQMRAFLRRTQGSTLRPLSTLVVGDLSLSPATRTVSVGGRPPKRLTPLEFRMLQTLMMHPGQTIPSETLIERVWGYEGEGSPELVRNIISRLRAKIEETPRQPKYILTIPAVGYCLIAPPH